MHFFHLGPNKYDRLILQGHTVLHIVGIQVGVWQGQRDIPALDFKVVFLQHILSFVNQFQRGLLTEVILIAISKSDLRRQELMKFEIHEPLILIMTTEEII